MATRKTTARKPVAPKTLSEIQEENEFSVTSKEKEKELAKRSQALDSLQDFALDGVVKSLTDTSLTVNKSFLDLQQQIVSAGTTLENLNLAIEAKQDELQNLFNKEVVASSLQALLERHEEDEKVFAAKKATHEAQEADRIKELEKNRLREDADYKYKLNSDRRIEKDTYEHDLQKKKNAAAAEEAILRASWEKREQELLSKEAAFAAMKLEVEKFPEVLKKEKEAAASVAVRAREKDLNHEHALKEKGLQANLDLEKQKNTNLTEQVNALTREVERLRDGINVAQSRVVEIARDGFSSYGGSQALAAVTQAVGQQKENTKK